MIYKIKILYILPLFSLLPSLHSDFSPRLCTSQKFVNASALPSDEMSRDRNVSGALGAIEGAWAGGRDVWEWPGLACPEFHGRRG